MTRKLPLHARLAATQVLFLLSGSLAQAYHPASPLAADVPLSTAFTYQGELTSGGHPAVGPCDFQFSL